MYRCQRESSAGWKMTSGRAYGRWLLSRSAERGSKRSRLIRVMDNEV